MERRHRDSIWKIFNRLAETIAVFFYQGVVFYIQLVVFLENTVCT